MAKSSDLYERSLNYIARLAESKGVEYSLNPTRANITYIGTLQTLCAGGAPYSRSSWSQGVLDEAREKQIKDLCEVILHASAYPVLQDWFQPEPLEKEFEYYERMFRLIGNALNLCDTKYVPLKAMEIEIKFTISADDGEVLRLQPGVQLKLWEE